MNDTVVAIVSAFFIIGIVVGIIAVVAMSVLHGERRGNQAKRRGDQRDRAESYDDPYEPSGSGWDDLDSGPRRRWPGETDNDLSDR
jgi:FtsZ-interacting cell division protein ZipA